MAILLFCKLARFESTFILSDAERGTVLFDAVQYAFQRGEAQQLGDLKPTVPML